MEAAYHLRCECTLKRYTDVRRAFVSRRRKLLESKHLPEHIQEALRDVFELDTDGAYPDLEMETALWLDPLSETEQALRDTAKNKLDWFGKGPLPVSLVIECEQATGASYRDAFKLCKQWFALMQDESLLIWRARNQA